MRLDVQRNEHQPLASLLRSEGAGLIPAKKLGVRQNQRAALPVYLCNASSAIVVEAPGTREAEPVNVKAERGLNVGHVQDGTSKPVCHRLCVLEQDNLASQSIAYGCQLLRTTVGTAVRLWSPEPTKTVSD